MRTRIAMMVVLASVLLLTRPSEPRVSNNDGIVATEQAQDPGSTITPKTILLTLRGRAAANLLGETEAQTKFAVNRRPLQTWNVPVQRVPALAALYGEPAGWPQRGAFIAIFVILIVEAVLVVLLFSLIIRRKQADAAIRELTGRVIRAAEEERKHIARELHDDIGQRLSLISMQLGSFLSHSPASAAFTRSDLVDSHRDLDTVITDLHDLAHRLHSTKLEHLGLEVALRDLCERVSRQHRVQATLQAEDLPENLSAEVALCFFRVAQEALSNVVRHSSSESAEITVNGAEGRLWMEIRDRGIGFDPGSNMQGLGLATMQERLRSIGGVLTVSSRLGRGTVVTAEVALKSARKAA